MKQYIKKAKDDGDMIPRIKDIAPVNDYRLHVRFDDGKEVIYDVKEDIEQIPCFLNWLAIQDYLIRFS